MIFIEKLNNIYIRLSSDNYTELKRVGNSFRLWKDGAEFSAKFKMNLWDGKISLYNFSNNTLPFGLWRELLIKCEEMGIECVFKNGFDSGLIDDEIDFEFVKKFCGVIDEISGIECRDYQIEAIYKALKYRRGIVEYATASGKSYIQYIILMYLIAMSKAKKAMLVVPTISLVNQMYSDFKDYKMLDIENRVCKLNKDTKKSIKENIGDFDGDILITTWQSVYKKDESFFKNFDCIICDEVHQQKSQKILGIMTNSYCEYRFGFTGTMPDDEKGLDYYTMLGYFGTVIATLLSKDLIDMGYATDLKITSILLKYPDMFKYKNQKRPYESEIEAIESYQDRDNVLKFIVDNSENKNNFLVLVKHTSNGHLKRLAEYLRSEYPDYDVFEIDGKTKGSVREDVRNHANNNQKWMIVSTYACFSTGINIKSLSNIIFMSPYKSKFKVVQSIGRGLRLHDSKSFLNLYDVVDDLCDIFKTGRRVNKNHSFKHYELRKELYAKQGFACREVDFDLEKLDYVKNFGDFFEI